MAAPSGSVAAAEQNRTSSPSAMVSTSTRSPSFCATSCIRPSTRKQSVEGERLPGRPYSPRGTTTRPGPAAQASTRSTRGAERGRRRGGPSPPPPAARRSTKIGEHDEDGAHCELRQPTEEKPADQQAQSHQHDRGGEPRKAANPVASQQNHQQNQVGRKRQRPEDLDSRKVKVEVHELLITPRI